MPAVRDLLDRFRPAGAPGAATAAGVPADRQASAARELEPVFVALAPVAAECAAVRSTAQRAAEQRAADAERQCRTMVAKAEAEAEAYRAEAATRMREDAAARTRTMIEQARAEADTIRRRAESRRPVLVADVLARVRAELAAMNRSPT